MLGGVNITPGRWAARIVAVAALVVVAGASVHIALLLSPALLLAFALINGMFPGERVIERLRARYEARRIRPVASPSRPQTPLLARRTGRLMAFALAMRPPPARVVHTIS